MALQRYFVALLISGLLWMPLVSNAQIIVLPDCNVEPQNPFCQGQCIFDHTLPWCIHPEPEHDPIVLVPGMLASYNKKLLFADQEGGSWDFVPFGNFYTGLIEKLEEVGFIEGENLFIAHYDWRQPNSESATEYLKPVIEEAKEKTGAEKVDIIAHSMGGLVARSYIQGDEYGNDVDQLVMLGTPNKGAADAYVAWEGGYFPESWKWYSRLYVDRIHDSLVEKRNISERPPISFRKLFPSLRDLLPINSFAKKDENLIPVSELKEQNIFSQQLLNSQLLLGERSIHMATIAGTKESTLGTITLQQNRSPEDEALERWRDGHPVEDQPPLDATEGDNRVLVSSAHLGDENITLEHVAHTELPEASQNEVLEMLGIEDETPPIFKYEPPQSLIGWVVLSPVNLIITAPDGRVLSPTQNDFGENAVYDDDPEDPVDPQVITIKNPPDGKYTVVLTGTGKGEYTVITSYGDPDTIISTQRSGTTNIHKEETTSVVIRDGSFIAPPEDISSLLTELKDELMVLKKSGDIGSRKFGKLYGPSTVMEAHGKKYAALAEKYGFEDKRAQQFYQKIQSELDSFKTEFNRQIDTGLINKEGIEEIIGRIQRLEEAGV